MSTVNPLIDQELKYTNAVTLRAKLPLYPTIYKEVNQKEISFSTVVRKFYNGKYYLIPFTVKGQAEARLVHELHSQVYTYFMVGELDMLDSVDSNQQKEKDRIKSLKK